MAAPTPVTAEDVKPTLNKLRRQLALVALLGGAYALLASVAFGAQTDQFGYAFAGIAYLALAIGAYLTWRYFAVARTIGSPRRTT